MPYHRDQKRQELTHIGNRIRDAVYQPLADLTVHAWVTPEPTPYANRETGTHLALKPGDRWGGLFDCAWFHFTGTIPPEAAGKPTVLLIDLNGEALVVDGNGDPALGLTTVSSEYDFSLGAPGKRVVPVTESAAGGEAIDIWADAGCNDLFGRLQGGGALREASIAVCKPALHALAYDWEVLHDLLHELPEDSARWARIWAAMCNATRELRYLTNEEAERARAILAPELAKRGPDPSLTVSAIGHAHIDLAWLWPIRETIRKGARTFSTVLANMDRYPDYVFGASQPQLYQWMKDRYPALYERIRKRVAEGRWEAQGAMWVEADTNITGAESLVRQLLYGKRFFRQELGKEVTNLWLPDVFGYSGALPQLLKKSGVEYFVTQKLSWSLVNRYPHHTFLWRGIDGSEVLAHLPPEDTYNSSAAPRAIAKAERGFLDNTVSDRCLLLFGIGDGGGGPGEEHLERLAREKNLAGLCPVVQESAERFFEQIEKDRGLLQSWTGELYLERHQGTYTTQARTKRANRKTEIALREAEWASAQAFWTKGKPYPTEAIETIWKEALLYQFHDILPGSSITRVYTESLARYAVLQTELEQITRTGDEAVFTTGNGPALVGNSLSWERDELLKIDGKWARAVVPSMGAAPVRPAEPDVDYTAPTASVSAIENDLLRVAIAEDGSLPSIFDKAAGRELLRAGAAGNRLAVYLDPGDAWDFAMDYAEREPEHFALLSTEAYVDGPEAGVRQVYTYSSSTLTQVIALRAGSRRIEFRTHVDWRESQRMLRTSFPVAIHADEATCEIQFGSIRRPCHANTLWDMAKGEICAHRWVDLSERGFGVALLNDCKYGYNVHGGILDLNLLRSPGYPDPEADRAEHDFTYALLPHDGDFADGGVVRAGYELNVPLRVIGKTGDTTVPTSLLTVNAPNVIVEAVKKAEDSDALIVRLYEAHGKAVTAEVRFADAIASAELVDLMEEHPEEVEVNGTAVSVPFRPFEVQTVRVTHA